MSQVSRLPVIAFPVYPVSQIARSAAHRLRVRYCECDPMGYVHHASYPWLEIGRTEILRDAGLSYRDMETDGIFLVIVKLEARFRRPGRYDDLVEVRTRVTGGSRVKILHEYDVVRVGPPDEQLMSAASTLACVDRMVARASCPHGCSSAPATDRSPAPSSGPMPELETISRMATETEARIQGLDPTALACPGCSYSLANLPVIARKAHCPECGRDTSVLSVADPQCLPSPWPRWPLLIWKLGWPAICMVIAAALCILCISIGGPAAIALIVLVPLAGLLAVLGPLICPSRAAHRLAHAHAYAASFHATYWCCLVASLALNVLPLLGFVLIAILR